MLNFSDITMYVRFKREEEKNRLLSTLNTSVHHEMLGPLKINIDIVKRLIKQLKKMEKSQKLQEMASVVLISSRQILLHANDLLDQ